jgi:undecaprenyl-diphosphatase
VPAGEGVGFGPAFVADKAASLAAASNYSFPSGRSTASAAAALILVLVCRPLMRRRWSRIVLCTAVGAWAFAVGLSRVALVVHWPADVIGAWLFVVASVPAVGLLLRLVLPRDGSGQPVA